MLKKKKINKWSWFIQTDIFLKPCFSFLFPGTEKSCNRLKQNECHYHFIFFLNSHLLCLPPESKWNTEPVCFILSLLTRQSGFCSCLGGYFFDAIILTYSGWNKLFPLLILFYFFVICSLLVAIVTWKKFFLTWTRCLLFSVNIFIFNWHWQNNCLLYVTHYFNPIPQPKLS